MTGPPVSSGFDDYEGLIEVIADTLSRGDLADRIPTWIRIVESELSRDIPLRASEYLFRDELNGVDNFIVLPENLITLTQFSIPDTDPPHIIDIVSTDKFIDVQFNGRGLPYPSAGRIIGEKLFFAPGNGTAGDTYQLIYQGTVVPLSEEYPTNRILKIAPDCLLYGALLHSAPFIGDDERLQIWVPLYNNAKGSFTKAEWRGRLSGGPIRVRQDFAIDDRHNIGAD
jgi:hypothetical protein